jgi:hypothetical protein
MLRKLFLVLLVLLIAPSAMASQFNITFSSTDIATTNVSYVNSQGPATPLPIAAGVAIIGIILLAVSIVMRPESGADIFSVLSIPPLLISMWQFLSIDIVTGFGVTSQPICDTSVYETGRFVLMENHTIYASWSVSLMLFIFFIISVLNVYRVLTMIRASEAAGNDGQ